MPVAFYGAVLAMFMWCMGILWCCHHYGHMVDCQFVMLVLHDNINSGQWHLSVAMTFLFVWYLVF